MFGDCVDACMQPVWSLWMIVWRHCEACGYLCGDTVEPVDACVEPVEPVWSW